MHMSDTLISTPVAAVAGIAAASLLVVAGSQLKKNTREGLIPLMGVAGAFVFAAQMINFSIPGTGSSGHIVGGVLLAALLGPWAAFITLSSVLIIQCLVFADGGLMALGCNILNMAAMSTLVAYPLLFKPLVSNHMSGGRVMAASIAASVIGLEGGACMVTLETMLSGVTALSGSSFLLLMTGIHLAIGICEGLATGAVLMFILARCPALIHDCHKGDSSRNMKKAYIWIGILALVVAGGLSLLASSDPDGLEWSISRIAGTTELPAQPDRFAEVASNVQTATAVMPDYNNYLAGIIGAVMVLLIVWGISSALMSRRKSVAVRNDR